MVCHTTVNSSTSVGEGISPRALAIQNYGSDTYRKTRDAFLALVERTEWHRSKGELCHEAISTRHSLGVAQVIVVIRASASHRRRPCVVAPFMSENRIRNNLVRCAYRRGVNL